MEQREPLLALLSPDLVLRHHLLTLRLEKGSLVEAGPRSSGSVEALMASHVSHSLGCLYSQLLSLFLSPSQPSRGLWYNCPFFFWVSWLNLFHVIDSL